MSAYVDVFSVLMSICYNIIVLKFIHSLLKFFQVPFFLRKIRGPLRQAIEFFCGVRHSYLSPLTLVNVFDPDFSLPNDFYNEHPFPTPKPFSLTNAHFLCMASKLVYEDPVVVEKVIKDWNVVDQYYDVISNDVAAETKIFIFGNENAIVLAFRGTQPLSVINWYTDLDFELEDASAFKGRVHIGFLRALGLLKEGDKLKNDLYCKAIDIIDKSMKSRPNQKIYLTGHSLGAALATIFAAQLVNHGKKDKIGALYTFGQPRVGNDDFAGAINELCHGTPEYAYRSKDKDITNCKVWRFVNANDVIPHLPPILGYDYSHHGELIVIVADGRKIVKRASVKRFQLGPFRSIWLGLRKIYRRMHKETYARILLRIIGLFIMGIGNNLNDHLPCDYEKNLRELIDDEYSLSRELAIKNRQPKPNERGEESDDGDETEETFQKINNRLKDLRKFLRAELSLRDTVGRFRCNS